MTIMDEVLTHAKREGLKNEIVDQINHVRLSKQFLFPLELVGSTGAITDVFDKKHRKIQLKWKLEFPSVEKPGSKH